MDEFFPNLLAIFYVAFCLLAFRGHYIIDITTGIIVAQWIFFVTWKNEEIMDSTARKIENLIY